MICLCEFLFQLILLIPLAVWAGRSPAAVFEDVYELGRPNASFLATTESWNVRFVVTFKKWVDDIFNNSDFFRA